MGKKIINAMDEVDFDFLLESQKGKEFSKLVQFMLKRNSELLDVEAKALILAMSRVLKIIDSAAHYD